MLQRSLQFLVVKKWLDYDLKRLFFDFLELNRDSEVIVATSLVSSNEVVIPVCAPAAITAATAESAASSHQKRKQLRFISTFRDSSLLGAVFVWLCEAKMDVSLRSIKIKSEISGSYNMSCFLSHVATCQALTLECKGHQFAVTPKYFKALSSNRNLRTLRIHSLIAFSSIVDAFCQTLSEIDSNDDEGCGLTELSLVGNRINKLPAEKLKLLFETILSFRRLHQLTVNLRGNSLKEAELDVLLQAWEAMETRQGARRGSRRLKSILLDTPQHEEKIADMLLYVE